MNNQRERQAFLQHLKDNGQRVTPERLAVFDEIFEQHRHIDAEELLVAIQKKGHRISRATVYRNMDLMVDCGLVRKYRLGQRRFLYEHVHPGQYHDHLVCKECGRVVEFVSPGISALQREICRAHGFSADHHQFQILGLCEACVPKTQALS